MLLSVFFAVSDVVVFHLVGAVDVVVVVSAVLMLPVLCWYVDVFSWSFSVGVVQCCCCWW